MLFHNDIQTVKFKLLLFKLTGRPELNLARTASLEAWPLGNILMLLMKPPAAQGGNTLSFPHSGITKVGHRPLSLQLECRGIELCLDDSTPPGLKFRRSKADRT
jgi:hypothetical protein